MKTTYSLENIERKEGVILRILIDIEEENYAMATVMDDQSLMPFSEICAGMKNESFP